MQIKTRRYDRIMEDLDAGMSQADVAAKYKTEKNVIRVYDMVRTHSLPRYDPPAPPAPPKRGMTVVEMYRSGMRIDEIAHATHHSTVNISWELEAAGVTTRGPYTSHKPTPDEIAQIVKAYTAGETARSIARRFRMAQYRVYKYLQQEGAAPPPKGFHAMTEEDWAEAGRLYLSGLTLGDVAKRYHTAADRLSEGFTKRGVHVLTRSEIGKLRHKPRRKNNEG